jgi:hypothetical protein
MAWLESRTGIWVWITWHDPIVIQNKGSYNRL